MRKTLVIVGVILVVFAIGVWMFMSNLDVMAKSAIEKQGSQITKVSVNVNEVKISPKMGEGHIKDLMIGNPAGFSMPYAFSFANITLNLDVQSTTTPVVTIHQLTVATPNVNIEQTANGNNLHVIQQNIQDYIAANANNTSDKKFIIDSLKIQNATLHVNAPQVKPEVVSIPLADIEMLNIGKDKGGISSAEVLALVMQQINVEIAKALTSRGLDNMVDLQSLGITPATITDRIRNFFNQL